MSQVIIPTVALDLVQHDGETGYGLFREGSIKKFKKWKDLHWEDLKSPRKWGSRINGYGGSSWGVHRDRIWAVTAEGELWFFIKGQWNCVFQEQGTQWADGVWDPIDNGVVLVQSQDDDQSLVWIDQSGQRITLSKDGDFFASPAISPQGNKILWLTWNHPNMSWDETILHQADMSEEKLINRKAESGGSFQQPRWLNNDQWGYLHDKNGYWQLWTDGIDGKHCLNDQPYDCCYPLWQLGQSTWAPFQDKIVLAQRGEHSWRVSIGQTGDWKILEQPWTRLDSITSSNQALLISGGNAHLSQGVYCPLQKEIIWQAHPKCVSQNDPEPISHQRNNQIIFDSFYAPNCPGPWPLLVHIHGGPTDEYDTAYDWRRHYWLEKGFAFCAVHYRGSSGSGRNYRQSLNGFWGVHDAEDCLNAVQKLLKHYPIDPSCIIIRGSSSGGLTALSTLMQESHPFTCGSCYYPVTKQAVLDDVHPFESHYSKRLIGSANFWDLEKINVPVIVFHGDQDAVISVDFSRELTKTLQKNNPKSHYCEWPNEGHGFRDARVIQKTLDLEYAFFSASSDR